MDMIYSQLLGQNIRMLRRSKRLTQQQLADKLQAADCKITRSALAKIEVGQRHLYPHEIKALKTILKVRYDDIFV